MANKLVKLAKKSKGGEKMMKEKDMMMKKKAMMMSLKIDHHALTIR